MSRTLYLHCGPAKTGTSAIQAILRDTPPDGVFYPETGQWPDGAHHKLMFAMRGMTRRGTIDIPPFDHLMTALVQELDQVPDQAESDVVLSSEAFGLNDIGGFLEQLDRRLARPFDHVQAIVVLRHPLERAASAFNQNVKDMAVTAVQMPKPYLDTHGPNFRLAPLVRAWKAHPLAVTFLNYHPPDTLVDRFFETIGHLPQGHALPREIRNRSISGYGVLTLLAGRMAGLTSDQLTRLFAALRQDPDVNVWHGPSFPFARNSCMEFLDSVVAPDLAEVQQLTGLTFPDLSRDLPRRFHFDDAELETIRRRFAPFDLTPAQQGQRDRVLAAFGPQRRRPQNAE